jgi:hypothetical protein
MGIGAGMGHVHLGYPRLILDEVPSLGLTLGASIHECHLQEMSVWSLLRRQLCS